MYFHTKSEVNLERDNRSYLPTRLLRSLIWIISSWKLKPVVVLNDLIWRLLCKKEKCRDCKLTRDKKMNNESSQLMHLVNNMEYLSLNVHVTFKMNYHHTQARRKDKIHSFLNIHITLRSLMFILLLFRTDDAFYKLQIKGFYPYSNRFNNAGRHL